MGADVDDVIVWSRESSPAATVPAVVPTLIPRTAAELVPLLVNGAETEITPDDPAGPVAPAAPAGPHRLDCLTHYRTLT